MLEYSLQKDKIVKYILSLNSCLDLELNSQYIVLNNN